MNDNDIVISGISGRYPECENVEDFWHNLINGIPMYTADDRRWPVDLLDLPKYTGKLKNIEVFDAGFFGLPDNEANQMDPQMRIFHETTYEAIYDAGVDPATLRDTATSVYLGSCYNDAANAKFEEITSTTQNLDIGPSEISKRFRFRGATVLLDTACASSFSALHEAVQSLKMNICDQAVVGGIALHLKPGLATGFRNLRMLSPDGLCKCLDAKADGYCRSEAVVSMFIQRRKYAKRIYATVLHSKTNSDGYKTEGITFPSREAQYKLMKECYEEARIDPEEKINYVEAHITGTPVGDPVESGALVKALRPNRSKPILMGCLKSSIGHSEGGSALCSITKVCCALQRRELPPNLNYETPNPNIDELKTGLIKPVIERQEFHESLVALNSFGFGGVNVHAILKANEKVLKPDDFNWLPESGINRLVNISNRTIEGLNYTINYLKENRSKVSKDYLGLIDNQSKIDVKSGLCARGFAIFDNDGNLIEKRVNTIDQQRPVWFVFNGLGSQWSGMAKRLLVFDVFRESIERMANVLKKHNIDLIHLLTEAGEDAFEKDLCNVLVCITSTQIALVDFFHWLDVKPDGIFGHSVGEYGAAYAAGSATAEQIIELVYHLGRCNNELHKNRGAMASIGLSWEDAVKLCQQTGDKVFASCDNNDSNVTISGDYDQVQQIVEKLNKEDVFAKNVFCCEMAFHCQIANVSYDATLNEFRKILIKPIKRADNWISTSVKPEQLQDERFSHFTADYCSNNMIAPVYFREALQKVPSNAVIIEFGPHSQLLPLIKRQLGANVICVPLTKRNTENEFDNANVLLSGLGQFYQSGNNLSIDKLYPKIEFPVARETLSLSHLLKWNHDKNYFVAKFPFYFNFLTPTIKFKVDLVDANQKFYIGHCIDGRILFPATGYLNVVWSQLARMNKKVDANELPVEFHNINLLRAVIIPKNGSATLQITLLEQTGEFAISEGGTVCCTGRINLIPDNTLHLNHNLVKRVIQEDAIILKTKDIYKELRIRGYDYSGMFQGVVEASSDGSWGRIKWTGNWVTFSDCMLQMAVFGNQTSRTLHLPTFVEYVRIDSKYLLTCADEMRKETGQSIFEVHYDKYANIGMTKGILVKGLKASPAPRRQNVQSANIEYYEFTPYNQKIPVQVKLTEKNREYLDLCLNLLENKVEEEKLKDLVEEREDHSVAQFLKDELLAKRNKEDFDLYQELLNRDEQLAKDKLIRINFGKVLKNQLSTVIENHFSKQIKIVEVNCTAGLISAEIEEHMQAFHVNTIYNIMQETATSSLQPSFVEKIIEFSAELNTIPSSLDKIQLMVFADWSLSFLSKLETSEFDYQVFLKSGIELMVPGAFLVFCWRSKYTPYELEIAKRIEQYTNVKLNLPQKDQIEKLLAGIGFVQIGSNFDEQTNVHSLLVRKPTNGDTTDEDHYQLHVENLNYAWVDDLKTAVKEKRKRVWLIADRKPTSGLIGMAHCLKREPGGDRIRCIFNATDEEIKMDDELKKKDLFFNIYKKEKANVGSYRHYTMNLEKTKTVKDAYVDVLTKGDLSSLRWLELDRTWKDDPTARRVLINYAALNFKDVMVATGRVPLSAYPASRDFCNVGMEFSGIDEQTGKRVFGFTNCGTIGNKISIQEESFAVEVPDHWSLAEASTVPVVYVTVYYSLFIRGNLLAGESILIHAGSGGVGQAAISVCLRKGCEVFTTVGSEEKKKFLLDRFPQLKEENIFNSRSDKFEEDVLKATDGLGVNMILNSLSEEKLRSSINCLSEYGRFIEIGKYDMVVNNKMDMSNFIKNKTFSVVCVAHLQDDALNKRTPSAINIMHKLNKMLKLGVQNGEVQPLPYTIFKRDEVETAFRYMASGKHIGKVLIQVQDETQPIHTYEVLPKSNFSSEKSYIVTGGLGGFGLELAGWLREKGVTKILLSSRNGVRTPYQELSIQRLRKDHGINVLVSKNTCTTYSSAASLIEEAMSMGPVGGIFNLAMVLKDSILENQSPENFEAVCLPKVNTTIYLDKLSRKLCPQLDYFICFSSVAAALGNPGQSNYGYANSVMERIVEQRREDGLHGLAIQWGAVGDVGVVAENFGNDVNLGGTVPQRIPFCLEIMDKFICSDHTICSSVVLSATKKSLGKDKNDLVRVICHVIGVKDVTCLDPNTTLLDLGLDSLMAVEIKQGLEREYETVLSTQEIRELTIRDLQEIGARKQAVQMSSGRKGSTDLTALTIHNIFTKMPTKLFAKLNTVEEKEPIFFIPPIEADFKLMMMLLDQLNRPVIGVNWTEECSKMITIKEVATYIAEKLIEEYPVSTYDLVGYSFGSCIAYQLSYELQERLGSQSVQKLIFLDGSPDLLRIQTENLIKVNETHDEASAFTAVTITFVQVFHEIENVEVIREQLLELPTKKEKTEMIAEYLSTKLQFKVDAVLLEKALDSYMCKLKMVYLYNPTHKFNGSIKLIKASEKGVMWVDQVNDADYGISKLLTEDGSYEVIQVQGDHRTFITNNAQQVGALIDSIVDYIPL